MSSQRKAIYLHLPLLLKALFPAPPLTLLHTAVDPFMSLIFAALLWFHIKSVAFATRTKLLNEADRSSWAEVKSCFYQGKHGLAD